MFKKTFCFALLGFYLISSHAYKISDDQKLKSNNSCEQCDLTEENFPRDISGLSFKNSYITGSSIYGTNASNTDFKNSNFVFVQINHSNFKNADFSNVNASFARFVASTFSNATFKNTKMDHSSFVSSTFIGADFSGSNLEKSDFSYANFYNSNITEEQLKTLKSYKCATLPNGELYDNDGQFDCSFSNYKNNSLLMASNKQSHNNGAKFLIGSDQDKDYFYTNHYCNDCDLSGYYFCPYVNMDFSNSTIIDSDMRKSKIYNCEFKGAQILRTFMFGVKIDSVHFEESNFESSKMDYIDIDNSHFSGSSFKNASLKKAKLRYSNFSNSDLANTNLKDVSFYKVILIGSNISKQQLEQASSIQCTVLPNGEVAYTEDDSCI